MRQVDILCIAQVMQAIVCYIVISKLKINKKFKTTSEVNMIEN